jgi:hypothetical protein
LAKPAARRLKVFQTRIGFYDTVVAASSQAAALRAWGLSQNLFPDGRAWVTMEPEAVQAALAHPDTPLRRAAGASDPFELEPAGLPKVPDMPRTGKRRVIASPAVRQAERPQADRGALNKAEAALRGLDEARMGEEALMRKRQAELDAARDKAQAAYVEGRRAATAAVVDARQAYRKAGGKN